MILEKVANTEPIQELRNQHAIAEHYQNYEPKYEL